MTRTQKMMLVGLIVLVLVFILVTARGLTQPACLDKLERDTPRCKPGGGMKGLGALTAPFAKGLKLPQASYTVAPNADLSVNIPATSDKMRSLKMKLTEGSAGALRLVNLTPDDGDMKDQSDEKKNTLPRYDDDNALVRTKTLVVTEQGARLTMYCTGSTRCRFETE